MLTPNTQERYPHCNLDVLTFCNTSMVVYWSSITVCENELLVFDVVFPLLYSCKVPFTSYNTTRSYSKSQCECAPVRMSTLFKKAPVRISTGSALIPSHSLLLCRCISGQSITMWIDVVLKRKLKTFLLRYLMSQKNISGIKGNTTKVSTWDVRGRLALAPALGNLIHFNSSTNSSDYSAPKRYNNSSNDIAPFSSFSLLVLFDFLH